MPNIVAVFIGLGVVALLIIMTSIAKMFRKAGPNEAIIVYGFRGPRIIKGHGTMIFPMVESCRQLSLELMSLRCRAAAGPLHQAGRRRHRRSGGADQGHVRPGVDSHRGRAVPDQDARRSAKA